MAIGTQYKFCTEAAAQDRFLPSDEIYEEINPLVPLPGGSAQHIGPHEAFVFLKVAGTSEIVGYVDRSVLTESEA